MKAELTKEGYIKVTAETITEAWALNITCPPAAEECDKCGVFPTKVIIDGSILLPNGDDDILKTITPGGSRD